MPIIVDALFTSVIVAAKLFFGRHMCIGYYMLV